MMALTWNSSPFISSGFLYFLFPKEAKEKTDLLPVITGSDERIKLKKKSDITSIYKRMKTKYVFMIFFPKVDQFRECFSVHHLSYFNVLILFCQLFYSYTLNKYFAGDLNEVVSDLQLCHKESNWSIIFEAMISSNNFYTICLAKTHSWYHYSSYWVFCMECHGLFFAFSVSSFLPILCINKALLHSSKNINSSMASTVNYLHRLLEKRFGNFMMLWCW